MTVPRFHQSMAKVLLSECPAILKAKMDAEARTPTRAMEKGTLVDQMVFGGASFHIVEAFYKSGLRKGKPVDDFAGGDASEQAAEARSRGQVPCLPHEYEAARRLSGLIKSRMLEAGLELDRCHKQETIQWTSAEGVECEGTPDLFVATPVGYDTIDLKVGHTANPDRLEQHLYDQGWHIQGAAYQEALNSNSKRNTPGKHWLVCAEAKSGADCITIAPLSEAYLEIGRKAWARAQRLWLKCWQENHWPEYEARVLMPTKSVMYREGLTP